MEPSRSPSGVARGRPSCWRTLSDGRRRSRDRAEIVSGVNKVLVQRVLDHRDPHLLGPPLRPDPQSYSALSDYLLTTYSYPTLFRGSISAIVFQV